jgi:hypothetical protein
LRGPRPGPLEGASRSACRATSLSCGGGLPPSPCRATFRESDTRSAVVRCSLSPEPDKVASSVARPEPKSGCCKANNGCERREYSGCAHVSGQIWGLADHCRSPLLDVQQLARTGPKAGWRRATGSGLKRSNSSLLSPDGHPAQNQVSSRKCWFESDRGHHR